MEEGTDAVCTPLSMRVLTEHGEGGGLAGASARDVLGAARVVAHVGETRLRDDEVPLVRDDQVDVT